MESCVGALSYREVFGEFYVENKTFDVHFLEQPYEALDRDWFTHTVYSTGPKRLDAGDVMSLKNHPDVDVVHMNDLFGEIYLRNMFEKHLALAN